MINKVSDFKLSEAILKSVCQMANVKFIDVSIELGEENPSCDNCLSIGQTKNIGHTIYRIVSEYIVNDNKILGQSLFPNEEKKESFLLGVANMARGIMYAGLSFDAHIDELTLQGLYQRTLVWIIMKDIICPVYHIPLKNIKIITGDNPYADIARYYKEGELQGEENPGYPFIFVNNIEDDVLLNAFLFIEVLKANNLSPLEIIKDILESDISEKFVGALKIAFNNDEVKIGKFITLLTKILGIEVYDYPRTANILLNMTKFAQNKYVENPLQWWYLGILESMLASIRGADWTTHQNLEQYVSEFWDEVEKIKQKRQSKGNDPGVPFDELLRIKVKQTSDNKTDSNRTLQSLLSSDRIW